MGKTGESWIAIFGRIIGAIATLSLTILPISAGLYFTPHAAEASPPVSIWFELATKEDRRLLADGCAEGFEDGDVWVGRTGYAAIFQNRSLCKMKEGIRYCSSRIVFLDQPRCSAHLFLADKVRELGLGALEISLSETALSANDAGRIKEEIRNNQRDAAAWFVGKKTRRW